MKLTHMSLSGLTGCHLTLTVGDVFYARDVVPVHVPVPEDGGVNPTPSRDLRPTTPVDDLKDRYYVLVPKDETLPSRYIPHLDIGACDLLLAETHTLCVHYGTIERGKHGNFVLSTRWAHRSVGNTSWWKNLNCPRIMTDTTGFSMSRCGGAEETKTEPSLYEAELAGLQAEDLDLFDILGNVEFVTE